MLLWPLKMGSLKFLMLLSVAEVDALQCVGDSLIKILK